MSNERVIIPESVFDTTMVDALAAADSSSDVEGIDLQQMKQEIQDAGFACAVIPAAKDGDSRKYAEKFDRIADLETHILDIEEYKEGLEARIRSLENDLRWQIEISDKASGLTNETKRKIAYEQSVQVNDELQKLYGELRIFRRTIKELQIDRDNELRAFQLTFAGGKL